MKVIINIPEKSVRLANALLEQMDGFDSSDYEKLKEATEYCENNTTEVDFEKATGDHGEAMKLNLALAMLAITGKMTEKKDE